MVGFIKGFLRPKANAEPIEVKEVKEVKPQKASEAFFLDADGAKTLGNIDYMRSTKVIKRSFPKTKSGAGGFELIQEVSAMEMVTLQEESMAAPANNSTPTPTVAPAPVQPSVSQGSDEAAERRRTDTSMDMFRSMARTLKTP